MHIRGVRGAITVEENSEPAIFSATRELLAAMVRANHIESDEVAAVILTATPDLDAVYPAESVRQMGWSAVPLLSVVEMPVRGALPRCLRALVLWNTPRSQEEIVHVYLRGAEVLRPDLKAPPRRGGTALDDA